MILLRCAWALLAALLYKLAMVPLVLAGFVLVPFAIWFGVHRKSRITGVDIFTAPDWLDLYGNEQEGYDSAFAKSLHPTWPTFWRRYVWAAWRNKYRNLPFWRPLRWLHRPNPDSSLKSRAWTWRGVRFRVSWRGWMTEFEWSRGSRYGDFGPRLDQPDSWGGVSWAFRPWGKG